MGDSSGPSGFRRVLSWCFWIFFIVVVGGTIIALVARSIFINQTDAAWEQAVAETEATDPEWRWEQLEAKRAKIPDEQNSALVMLRLRDSGLLKEQTSNQSKFDFEPDPASAAAEVGSLPREPLPMPDEVFEEYIGTVLADLQPEVRLSPAVTRAVARELSHERAAVTEALKLADMPNGRHPIKTTPDFISTLLPTIQYCRTVANLLALEATRLAEAGDGTGAMRAVRACLNVARSTGDEPMLIVVLVRIAIDTVAVQKLERVLGQGEAREAELASMQAALEAEAAVPRLVSALRGERAGMIKLCDAIIRGDVNIATLNGGQAGGVGRTFGNVAGELLARQGRPEMLRLYTQMIDITNKPTRDWDTGFEALEGPIKSGAVITRLLMPAVMKVSQSEVRAQATLRTAAVALAAERFRLKLGKWPENIRALTATGFLNEVSADPYTGEPLMLKRRPSGIVIYSVGPDRLDNGGAPLQRGPKMTGDVAFRLFDPKCRRAIAEPLPMPREQEVAGGFGVPLNGKVAQ
jgi:hypothetical protein